MQSEDKHQEQDQNHPYQQPDPTRVIWKALQRMKLGADRSRWSVHDEAQKEFEKDHRLCLVAKGLNMEHQNSPGIKEQHRPTRHMASWVGSVPLTIWRPRLHYNNIMLLSHPCIFLIRAMTVPALVTSWLELQLKLYDKNRKDLFSRIKSESIV